MHRKLLLELLDRYRPAESESRATVDRLIRFVTDTPDCLRRESRAGHLTGSAWIISPDSREALLIFHRKLSKWLQPGGHADGDGDLEAVARREAFEETGLAELDLLDRGIFDLDIHQIPAHHEIPAHLHYDVRFIFRAPKRSAPAINAESTQSGWFSAEAIKRLTIEGSVQRMVDKWLARFPPLPIGIAKRSQSVTRR